MEVVVTATRQEKEIKASDWKENIMLSLFANDLIVYIENPKESTNKLLDLINEFSKVPGYKISTHTKISLISIY